MALLMIKQPENRFFTSELGDIIIASPSRVAFTMKINQVTILNESYEPDANFRIYIRDLDKVINAYIYDALSASVQFRMTTTADDEITLDTTALYCRVRIDRKASDFLPFYFLTMLQDSKTTNLKAREYLSLFTDEPLLVTAKAKYRDGSITEQTLAELDGTEQVVTLDVSPSIFPQPEDLMHYVILAGERFMNYFMRPDLPSEVLQFVFRNAFGVKETFTPTGLVSRQNEYENLFGTFEGSYIRYHVEMVKVYTAVTGILDESMAVWIEDLFISRDVFLLTPTGTEVEVCITEASVKRSSALQELTAFEFKFRLSRKNHHSFTAPSRVRIFDDSFDYTFN
jgi:hypothetical protein